MSSTAAVHAGRLVSMCPLGEIEITRVQAAASPGYQQILLLANNRLKQLSRSCRAHSRNADGGCFSIQNTDPGSYFKA